MSAERERVIYHRVYATGGPQTHHDIRSAWSSSHDGWFSILGLVGGQRRAMGWRESVHNLPPSLIRGPSKEQEACSRHASKRSPGDSLHWIGESTPENLCSSLPRPIARVPHTHDNLNRSAVGRFPTQQAFVETWHPWHPGWPLPSPFARPPTPSSPHGATTHSP